MRWSECHGEPGCRFGAGHEYTHFHERTDGQKDSERRTEMGDNYDLMTQEGRSAVDADRERERIARQFHAGQRVRYSTCGDRGIAAGVFSAGEIVDTAFDTSTLVRVLFDGKSEPEWMDARLLEIE